MPTLHASRIAILAGSLGLLSACSTSSPDVPVVAAQQGTEAAVCPRIALREGTAILRRGGPEALEYVASITETSRSCRVIGGQLVIEVGIAGRVTPGVAARAGGVQLPIRVAVTRGTDVLYSNMGTQSVAVTPGAGAQNFLYVDRSVRIAEPADRAVAIQVGFDEQN